MRKDYCIYELVNNDKYEFPVLIADTLKELSEKSGINYIRLKNAYIRKADIDGFKVYQVDIREPEEKFNIKEYRLFCEKNNLKLGRFSSIKAFHKWCYGEL